MKDRESSLHRAAWTVVVAAFATSLMLFRQMPSVVAVHWDLHGVPNGWASRIVAAIAVPLLMTVLLVAATKRTSVTPEAAPLVPYAGESPHTLVSRRARPPAYELIILFINVFLYCVHLVGLLTAMSWLPSEALPRVVALLLSGLFILIGNYLPRVLPKKTVGGIHVPGLLTASGIWSPAQRLMGYGFVAVGIAGLVLAPWSQLSAVITLGVGAVLVVVVVAFRSMPRSSRFNKTP